MLDDGQAVEQARRGDERAWRVLYERHVDLVFGLARDDSDGMMEKEGPEETEDGPRGRSAPGGDRSDARRRSGPGGEEREGAWRRLAAMLPGPASGPAPPPGSAAPGPPWLSAAWKVAAAAAVVAMGLGVWQVNRHAGAADEWNPAAAIRGWEEDLEDLRPAPEEVRAALGYEVEETGVPGEALVERFAARVGEALGLERAQRERLAAELQRSRRERAELAQRRRELMPQLARLVTTGAPDQGRVGRLFEELLELRVRQARIDVEEDRRLSGFLTPLQRARLFHLKQRLAERALDRVDRRP